MGNNHALALDNKGNVFAWGSGQQNQLGRRLVERTAKGGLVPREFGLPKNKIKFIACGSYHSFAIDNKSKVWAWGANSYCETGIPQGLGDNNSIVAKPTLVESLKEYEIEYITGGDHHSLAVTKEGDLLVWGRLDGFQIGVKIENIPKDFITFDDKDVPRILHKPLKIEGGSNNTSNPERFLLINCDSIGFKVSMVAAGSDTSIAITTDGKAYSWGFSSNYQTGQGTYNDVEVATLVENTAVRGKRLVWAGCGGQYSMLASPAEDTVMVNGE
jgi:regulator of chromosome condensation